MLKHLRFLAVLGLAGLATACGGGSGSGITPTNNPINLQATAKLQFAVGTARIATIPGAPVGLNTVETFRQPNGLSATLVNTPTITGPAGFVVPAVAGTTCTTSGTASLANGGRGSGTDAGTNHISGTPQSQPGAPAICTTFGQSGGAFGYGFAPDNIGTGGALVDSFFPLPLYYGGTIMRYVGGPPTFPNVRNGTFPGGFIGYSEGFTDFNAAPVLGTYTLTVNAAAANGGGAVFNASSTLTSLVPLGVFPTPVFTPDGLGGGTIAINVPAGVTETMVEVFDLGLTAFGAPNCWNPGVLGGNGTAYYTLITYTTGPQVLALPDNLGPALPGTTAHTICTSADNSAVPANGPGTPGDQYRVYAVGYDYPAFEAAYPANLSQTPVITGAGGQADITTSARTPTTFYP